MPPKTQSHPAPPARCPLRHSAAIPATRPVRWLLAVAGVVCLGLAVAGALLPGLPATIFVLIGSFCLTRSCPWLEQRLMSTRLLRPYAKYLDPRTPFPRRSRFIAAGAMWLSIAVSVSFLVLASNAAHWVPFAVAAAGIPGTVCIATFRRGVRSLPAQELTTSL